MKVVIRGAVQGVGFRPFVYRLANQLSLSGWVLNNAQGVFIEVEGEEVLLLQFLSRLASEKPERSFIQSMEHSILDPAGYTGFTIRESSDAGKKTALILPDIATCPECLRETFDPANRRHLYPFTNCTHCGPRFTIMESLPYDRPNTTMKTFTMCDECRREYEDPRDRRFHAQPIACPNCGPHVELWEKDGKIVGTNHMALLIGGEIIRRGGILAIKGIGGFHLMVDARNERAVQLLRDRKHREEKPFALMFASLDDIKAECTVSGMEERLLQSPEAPIVLLERKDAGVSVLANAIAPSNPYLGVMLPYSPLHHLLMRELGVPVVATSGNLSDEPICTDEHEALVRLHDIADGFLVHDRPIVRHVDDSIVRVMAGREMIVRRARGFAPLPISVKRSDAMPILAVGAHLKNSVAISVNENIFVSQHIGDLETAEAFGAFQRGIVDLQGLFETCPGQMACDMHPEYLSTKHAASLGIPVTPIQHHHAHVASCMAENELEGRVLGVSWDGTGYGPDGTIWGGEFLMTDAASFTRFASFKPFRLPGGDKAVKEPRRVALGVLHELMGDALFVRDDLHPIRSFFPGDLHILQQMLAHGVNSPITTSAGRLFDAVASIIGLRQRVSYEGQAAMGLEFSIGRNCSDPTYRYRISELSHDWGFSSQYTPSFTVDWTELILGILDDVKRDETIPTMSLKFHNTLCAIIVDVAKLCGEERVVLSGGCFQNKYLTERTITLLRAEGFQPYWHQRVPPNDGGVALGQIYACMRNLKQQPSPEPEQESILTTHHLIEEETAG